MFLSSKNTFKNSNRSRKFLKWNFLKNFIVNKKYNYIYSNKTLISCFTKIIKTSNRSFFYKFSDFYKNSFFLPLSYGFIFGNIFYKTPYDIFFKKKFFFKNTYLFLLKQSNMFFFLQKQNSIFIKSKGTFGRVIRHEFLTNRTYVLLPSKKKKFFPMFSKCFLGRNYDIFHKYVVLGSYGFRKKYTFKSKVSVRGIAMNPVDHPNGGRTKTKKPFKNKYNKIAKFNK